MSDASIDLYRTRSATDVINVTFRFLRDQFGPLLKGLLVLAGPPLILASTLGSFVVLQPAAPMTGGNAGLVLLQLACALIGGIIVAAVSIGALDVYHREGRAGLTVRRLWGMVRTYGMALFGRQIQAGVVVILGALLIGALGVGLGAALRLLGGGSVLSLTAGAITGILLIVWFLYAYPRFSMLLPGQMDPDRSISLMRCVRLVRGRWGQTLGVLLLALVISMVIFSVGWIPQFLLGALRGVGVAPSGPVGPLIAGLVGGVANTLSSAVSYTALTVQYYNLVEQEEQVSLAEEVERIEQEEPPSGGEPSAPDENEPSPDSDESVRWRGDASGPPSN